MNVGETFIQITADMAVSHLRFFSTYNKCNTDNSGIS